MSSRLSFPSWVCSYENILFVIGTGSVKSKLRKLKWDKIKTIDFQPCSQRERINRQCNHKTCYILHDQNSRKRKG